MVARVENWVSAELPLKSTPFAAELPLRPISTGSRPPPPPEVFETNMPLLDLDLPPLRAPSPSSASVLPAVRSSRPPVPSPAAAPARPPLAPPARSSSHWWVLALLLVGVAAYFVLHHS